MLEDLRTAAKQKTGPQDRWECHRKRWQLDTSDQGSLVPTSITSITQGSEHLAVSVTISRVPIVTTVGPVPMTISRQALKSVVYRDRPPQSLQERNCDFLCANPGPSTSR